MYVCIRRRAEGVFCILGTNNGPQRLVSPVVGDVKTLWPRTVIRGIEAARLLFHRHSVALSFAIVVPGSSLPTGTDPGAQRRVHLQGRPSRQVRVTVSWSLGAVRQWSSCATTTCILRRHMLKLN